LEKRICIGLKITLSSWKQTLAYLFIAALVVRILFIVTLQEGFYFSDSVSYDAAAVNLLAKGEFGLNYDRPPVYALFLAGIYFLFGKSIFAVRIVQAIMGAVIAVIMAIIGKRVAGQKVGALAGALWSIYPLGVFIAGIVYSETVVATLLACGVMSLITDQNKRLGPKSVLVGGIIFGAAALTKSVVLITISAIALWLFSWERSRRIMFPCLFLVGVSLLLIPWTIHNFYIYGQLVPLSPRDSKEVAAKLHGSPNLISAKERSIKASIDHLVHLTGHFGREFLHYWQLYPDTVVMSDPVYRENAHKKNSRIVRKTLFGTEITTLVSIVSVGSMFLFGLIGTGIMWSHKEKRRVLSLFYIMILSVAIGHTPFGNKIRYRVPIEPYIIILCAYGLWQTWVAISGRYLVDRKV